MMATKARSYFSAPFVMPPEPGSSRRTAKCRSSSSIPGDLLVTIDHGSRTLQPIKWIGERRLDLAAHPHPDLAAPVRIRKDAFSEGIPTRDLLAVA